MALKKAAGPLVGPAAGWVIVAGDGLFGDGEREGFHDGAVIVADDEAAGWGEVFG
ncbi:MAG: hypothetical protein RL215_2602, partial [Planctomycetota bacterium]